jgi:carbon-monoxide dehydrogenase small subunit
VAAIDSSSVMNELVSVTITLNDRQLNRTAPAHYTLMRWLREEAQAFDVKCGCGEGVCGSCTVIADGVTVTSCIVLAAQFDGANVLTATGLLDQNGNLCDLQRKFVDCGAVQCGFCTPGMLLAARELLESSERLTRDQIREKLHGNLCRCTGYQGIVDAVEEAQRVRTWQPQ